MGLWRSEHLIGNEGLPWNTFLLQLVHNNHFNKRVMEEALHLLSIVSLLYNIGHFFNASVEVIRYVQHPHSSKMHKQPHLV